MLSPSERKMVRSALSEAADAQRQLEKLLDLPTGRDASGKESTPAKRGRKK
jgi:hypothetical protein